MPEARDLYNYLFNGHVLCVQCRDEWGARLYFAAKVCLFAPFLSAPYDGCVFGSWEDAQRHLDRIAGDLKLEHISKGLLNDVFWGG